MHKGTPGGGILPGTLSLPQFPARPSRKSLGARPWPGAIGHLGGHPQPSHPPACPDLPQTPCLSRQHLLPASSLPQSLFVFLPELSPPTEAVIQGRCCSVPCPAQPCLAALEGMLWEAGPRAGRRHPQMPGFRQPWLPVLSVESRAHVLEGGSGRPSACLGPSACSPSPLAPPHLPRQGLGRDPVGGGLGGGGGRGVGGGLCWALQVACLEQNHCSLLAPAALPHAGSTPSSHFLLSFSQFI